MRKYKLKNRGRRKAIFGTQEAATIAAAGISAAATIAGAAQQAKALQANAKEQADSVMKQAQMQTQSALRVNENNNQLQEQQQQFIAEQNQEARQLSKDTNMTLQMLAGTRNENERLEGAKIQVKCGGSARKKRLDGGASLLRGGSNGGMQVTVHDGKGGLLPLGNDGYGNLSMAIGANHDNKNGDGYTGLGLSITDLSGKKSIIEAEGNQNSNLGELIYTTPNDVKFLSKHSIKGFNPAKSVLQGLHPLVAFDIQEKIKKANGIKDNGSKAMYGLSTLNNIQNTDNMAADASGIVYLLGRRKLKCGGSTRKKAFLGFGKKKNNNSNNNSIVPTNYGSEGNNLFKYKTHPTGSNFEQASNLNPGGFSSDILENSDGSVYNNTFSNPSRLAINIAPTGNPDLVSLNRPEVGSTDTSNTNANNPYDNYYNRIQLGAAGINLGANFLSAGIMNKGTRLATKVLTNANNAAAALKAYGISQMKGIDPGIVKADNYRAGHMMPALRTPYVNVNPELALIERSRQRNQDVAARNSVSGASLNSRYRRAEIDAADQRSQVFSKANQLRNAIEDKNTESINEASKVNAMLDTQALKDRTDANLKVAEYNTNIYNTKATGIPDVYADNISNNAQIRGNALQTYADRIATANLKGAEGYVNTLSLIGKQAYDRENILAGIDSDIAVRNVIQSGNKQDAIRLYNFYKNSSNRSNQRYAQELKDRFNIQAKYGTSSKRHRLKYGGSLV